MTQLLDLDDNDDPRSRKFVYKNVVYTVTASDPFGHWHIKIEGKKTPVTLAGAYTSFQEAERAIHSYGPTTNSK